MVAPNPVAFTVFGIDVMWYGVLIGSAIVIACAMGCVLVEQEGMSSDKLIDVLLFAIPMAIIGARAYYVVFEWEHYAGDFMAMINIRNGGLAIHGGLIFGIGTGLLCGYIWKMDILKHLDIVAICVPLAQSIGRWGNFCNEEAHGGPTDFIINVLIDGETYHATFLYEAIWCYALCIFLFIIYRCGKKFDGQLISLYPILYSVERFFVEGLRTDSLMLGPLRQAQLISIALIILGIVMYITFERRAKRLEKHA
ncbi:MAG: prolipoprotein diacylglyceryl transferase [Firmicutes bacterium]|nr:prolipoprotein diacylglyceryl transferase [Bacillota bacterium]